MRPLPFAAVLFFSVVLAAAPASALPVFAHRYALTCQACHTTVPHLNAFGHAFQRAGYRLPIAEHGAIPVAVKVNVGYSSDAEAGLPKVVVDEVELLAGGAIGKRFNYFAEQYVLEGGTPGRTRDAWLQYNGQALHVRAGQFTLPLPVDPETERDTLAHYLIYDEPAGPHRFTFFDAHAGIEAYGATRGGLEAHAAAFAHGAMAYVSQSLGSGFTLSAYHYRGEGFYRQGYGLDRKSGKLDTIAVAQFGNGTRGGFFETHYAFSPALMAVARYDAVAGLPHQRVLSLVVRPARNMRFTLEDQITDHHTLNAAWLFAY